MGLWFCLACENPRCMLDDLGNLRGEKKNEERNGFALF